MDQSPFTRTLEAMVQRLVERFDPDEIILFGSDARGTAQPGSDIDLLVIQPVSGSKRAKQVEMRVALHDIPAPTDIIVATPAQVAQQRTVVGSSFAPQSRREKRSMLELDPVLQVARQWVQKAENDLKFER